MGSERLIIRNIKLENFRCHKNHQKRFARSTTKILGPNGCGKTSVLEAVYITMRGKSFRAVDREIINYDQNYYRIELEYSDGRKIIAFYQDEKKQFLIDGKKTLRLPKEHRYPVVIFEPKDLHIIESSPSRRRSFFDRIFSQLNPEYSIYLSRYNKALQQRNKAFKDEFLRPDMVFPWNMLLAEYGCKLKEMRHEFIEQINEQITQVYQKITGQKDQISIQYNNTKMNHKSKDISESQFLQILEKNFERDKILGCTEIGIHHDQYQFKFNNQLADGSASRGECRSIIIALKFIEAELVAKYDGRQPLILLDDVFSELDKKHCISLTENFHNHQVILTSVS